MESEETVESEKSLSESEIDDQDIPSDEFEPLTTEEEYVASYDGTKRVSRVPEPLESDLLPFDVLHLPEFQELIQEDKVEPIEKPVLFSFPDIQEQFESAMKKVGSHFNKTTVIMELNSVYQFLILSRSNERSLQDKLAKKEDEIVKLQTKIRRDPKLHRALILANSWRQEKVVEEQALQECGLALSNMKGDMKDLETKVNSLQIMNSKLHKHRDRNSVLEDQSKRLEEILLMKENRIADLVKEAATAKSKGYTDEIVERTKDVKVQVVVDTKCARELEDEIQKAKRRESLFDENVKRITELEHLVDATKRSENKANHSLKNILTSVKALRLQMKKIEASVKDTNRRNERMLEIQRKSEKKVVILEHRLRQTKLIEAGLQQALKATNQKNIALTSQLVKMSYFERKYSENEALMKMIHEKENENAAYVKFGQRLTDELKYTHMELDESTRNRESQQLRNNRSQQVALHNKKHLDEAIIFNQTLSKRLEFTENMLKHYKQKLDHCTRDTQDVLNIVRHLDSVCSEYEGTIRVKDAKNDSLVLTMSNMQELLNESRINSHHLRQMNLIGQNNHRRQLELNDMLTQLLNFTDIEKNTAVLECNRSENTVVILKRQQVVRLGQIASQYKDICDLKTNITKLLKSLDIQKKETNALRELLTKAHQHEHIMRIRVMSLTHERDLYGSVVIQKNIEAQLLEKKSTLLTIIIERGATKYRDLMNDVRILKLEIKNLRNTLTAKKNVCSINIDLRHELVQATRQYQLEQVKRRAMEEMKTPQIHKHVYLKNTDHSEYEKLVKIQRLQKMLISKYEDVATRENIILERDTELRESLLSEINLLTFDLSEYKKKFDVVLGDLKTANAQIAKHKRHAVQSFGLVAPRPLDMTRQMKVHKHDQSTMVSSMLSVKELSIKSTKETARNEAVSKSSTSNAKSRETLHTKSKQILKL